MKVTSAYFERFKDSNGEYMIKPGERIFHEVNHSGFNGKHEVTDSTSGLLRLNTNPYDRSGSRKVAFADWNLDDDLDLIGNSYNISLLEILELKMARYILIIRID